MGFVFNFHLRKEKALGAQAGFAEAFNKVIDILENIEGLGPVEIKKNGRDWRVVIKDQPPDDKDQPPDDDIPDGYADGTVIVDMQWDSGYKKIQIKTATALIKTGTTSDWTDKITFAAFSD